MKTRTLTLLCTGAALLATATLLAKSSAGFHRRGTDILHFSAVKVMTNEGALSNAVGFVTAKQNRQGKANNQELAVFVGGLETNATYQLLALVKDDTNQTLVAEFTADADGRAAVRYRSQGTNSGVVLANGRGHGHGHGHGHWHNGGHGNGKTPLPDALNPVSLVRELQILNTSTQAVLSADLTAPDKLQYLVKRSLGTNGAGALLEIKATTRKAKLQLLAGGLVATNEYWLVLNDVISQTNSTDANGRLKIRSELENPTDVLDLRSLALWDTTSNVVFSTELP